MSEFVFSEYSIAYTKQFKNEKIKKEQKLTYKILFWSMPSTSIDYIQITSKCWNFFF